jgi:serine/threonine protein kinase
MAPIFDAVLYCHDLGIVHRDIKPENLLLTINDPEQAIVKISDFGLARYINPTENVLAQTTCGTPGYVAPEVLEKKPYDYRCDYWSLAVVMFIMLSGTPPFYHEDNFELFDIIKQGDYNFEAAAWKTTSEEAKDLIRRLLVVDPESRITRDEIRTHPWITGEYKQAEKPTNVLNKLKEWNTERKLGVK